MKWVQFIKVAHLHEVRKHHKVMSKHEVQSLHKSGSEL